jgi:hypothetical protein
MVSFTPRPLFPGEGAPSTLWIVSRLGGPHSLYGHYGEEITLLPLSGIDPRFLCRLTLGPSLYLTSYRNPENPSYRTFIAHNFMLQPIKHLNKQE